MALLVEGHLYRRAAFRIRTRSLSRACQLILAEEKGSGVDQGGLERPRPFSPGGPAVRILFAPAASPFSTVTRNCWRPGPIIPMARADARTAKCEGFVQAVNH